MGLPRKIKNFATFVDGISYLGEMPEVALPKLARKMDDYRSGGMNAPVKADFGMEGMEAELTAAGCPKLSLQIREGNEAVVGLYQALGYAVDPVVSMGKRLIAD